MVELRNLEHQQGDDHSPSRHDESSSSSSSESSEGQHQVRKSRAEMDAAQILQQSPLFRNKSGRSSSSSPASPEQREPIVRSSSPGSHSINARYVRLPSCHWCYFLYLILSSGLCSCLGVYSSTLSLCCCYRLCPTVSFLSCTVIYVYDCQQ